jgi:hypothetical protein
LGTKSANADRYTMNKYIVTYWAQTPSHPRIEGSSLVEADAPHGAEQKVRSDLTFEFGEPIRINIIKIERG